MDFSRSERRNVNIYMRVVYRNYRERERKKKDPENIYYIYPCEKM